MWNSYLQYMYGILLMVKNVVPYHIMMIYVWYGICDEHEALTNQNYQRTIGRAAEGSLWRESEGSKC